MSLTLVAPSRRLRRGAVLAGAMLAATPALAAAASFGGASAPRQTDKASHGVVAVKVSCPRGTDKDCTGTVSLTSAKKIDGQYQSLGRARFTIPSNRTDTVKIKLTSEGKKLVQAGTVKPVATVSSKDGANHSAKHATTITVKGQSSQQYGGY